MPEGYDCLAEDARARGEAADVVVVNTHLYGMHLAMHGTLLPEHDLVVIDEAHQLEEVVSATLGHRTRTEPLPVPRGRVALGHRRPRAGRGRSTTWPTVGPDA